MHGIEFLNPKGLWLLTGDRPARRALHPQDQARARPRSVDLALGGGAARSCSRSTRSRSSSRAAAASCSSSRSSGLSLALARPALRGGKLTGDHVAIVIDTSASMGTAREDGGRQEDDAHGARDRGREERDRQHGSPGADAIVIEGAREARVVSPLDRDARRLKASLSSVGVREVEGDLSAAVALAADRLRSLGGKAPRAAHHRRRARERSAARRRGDATSRSSPSATPRTTRHRPRRRARGRRPGDEARAGRRRS